MLIEGLTGAAVDVAVVSDDGGELVRRLDLRPAAPGALLIADQGVARWLAPSGEAAPRLGWERPAVGSLDWAIRTLGARGIGPQLILLVVPSGSPVLGAGRQALLGAALQVDVAAPADLTGLVAGTSAVPATGPVPGIDRVRPGPWRWAI
jgi:hypothetical protein